MPTYQYACKDCDHDFEQVQAFTDPSLTECPSCGGRLRKVYGSVGVVFKGSGFYRTDSRSGNGKASITADHKSESSASSDSSASQGGSEKKSGAAASAGSSTGSSSSGATSSAASSPAPAKAAS